MYKANEVNSVERYGLNQQSMPIPSEAATSGTCNDQGINPVGSSDPKRLAPIDIG
jgi:hypothetical protein